MARRLRHSRFETRTARLKLSVSKKPYTVLSLAPGVTLLYRRNKGNGTWVDKVLAGDGRTYWTKGIAEADDYAEVDGDKILNFFPGPRPCQGVAAWPRCRGTHERPITVAQAFERLRDRPQTDDAELAAPMKARQAGGLPTVCQEVFWAPREGLKVVRVFSMAQATLRRRGRPSAHFRSI